ncbi:MAG: hypothetical protein AAF391_06325 [Bacteroidota bacterium]
MRLIAVCAYFLLSSLVHAQWDNTVTGQITYIGGKVGIGTISPSSSLHIQADGVSGGEGILRLSVSDASPDYLTFSNSTGASGQFIPLIRGHHQTDNRVSFQMIGQTSAIMDTGNQPLIGFSARVDNNFVNTRPLFQWSNFTSKKMTMLSNGNLGLGTTTPNSRLHVQADAASGGEGIIRLSVSDASADYLTLSNSTGAGGQFIPLIRGHHETDNRVSFQLIGQTSASMDTGNKPLMGFSARVDNNFVNTRPLFQWSNFNSIMMTMLPNGHVGIGTPRPDARLTVAGNVHAKEVKVSIDAGTGPDYVFEEDYNLRSLKETDDYIKENKHLPEVPSAKEMEASGVQVGEMHMVLLKKIEELTLHTIAQQRMIEEQGKVIEEMKKEIMKNTKKSK